MALDPLDPDHPRIQKIRRIARFRIDGVVPGAEHVPFNPYELALETPPPPRLGSINVRPEDKAVFDAVQKLVSFHRGRSVTQWELFTMLLADAVANKRGLLAETGFGGG
ncbi:MAG: hypothetical protein QOE90_2043 [Thermoplasmata archaeon]|jgi:hypothetical protein|nr:hypothetical protein [Thermoplasmata archaeon]